MVRAGVIIENSAQDLPSRATVGVTMRIRRSLHLIGTGLLINLDDHTFVITAAHVVKGCLKYPAELGLVDVDGNFVALKGDWKCSPLRSYGTTCDPIDVAVQKIGPYPRNKMDDAMFIRLEDMDLTTGSSGHRYHLYGFPFSLAQRDDTIEARLLLRPLAISFSLYSGPTNLISDYKKQLHLLLDARQLSSQYITEEDTAPEFEYRNPCSLPGSIEGLSGSGVWCQGNRKKDKIAALQTGVYRRQRIIKATRWSMVMRMLCDAFPELNGSLTR